MAFTEKYVRADAAGLGTASGDNDTTNAITGALSFAEMLTDATSGSVRYNLKAGTYSRTTANDTFTTAGTTAAPRMIRGFNATLGDLAANGRTPGGVLVKTNFPSITYTTGGLTTPNFLDSESLSITTVKAGVSLIVGQSTMNRFIDAANTHASSASAGAIANSAGSVVEDCDMSIATSNIAGGAYSSSANAICRRCLCIGGTNSTAISLGGGINAIIECVIRDSARGINGGSGYCDGCAFRNISGNYINNGGLMQAENCVAWGSGGSSVWYNSTTTVRRVYQNTNFVGNMGSADVNTGDWPDIGKVSLSADPFVSSTDLQLNNTAGGGALVRASGYNLYKDGGAWQVQPSTGSTETCHGAIG